jgi:hypothetical protein
MAISYINANYEPDIFKLAFPTWQNYTKTDDFVMEESEESSEEELI